MIDRIYALRKSLHNYANGGYVLIAVTVLAMVIANSPFKPFIFHGGNGRYCCKSAILICLNITAMPCH